MATFGSADSNKERSIAMQLLDLVYCCLMLGLALADDPIAIYDLPLQTWEGWGTT